MKRPAVPWIVGLVALGLIAGGLAVANSAELRHLLTHARRRQPTADIERARADNEAAVDAIAARMASEPRDDSWSRPTELRLDEALRSQAMPHTELVSVECRTSMCAATFQHSDPLAQRYVAHYVGVMLPYAAETVYVYSRDRSATSVYISREGTRFAGR
jgi:hypothetical protein